MSDHTEFSAMLQRCNERIAQLEAELAEAHNVAQALEDSAQEVRVELAEANAKIAGIRRYASEHLGWNEKHGLEILRVRVMCGPLVTPKPTDNSESAT